MIHLITTKNLSLNCILVEQSFDQLNEYWSDKESIAIDTETTGFDTFNDRLLTVQLGDADEQWVVDCTTVDVIALKELLESKLLLFHNYGFDGKWLHHYGIDPKNIYDTFLAECVLTAGYESDERHLGLNDIAKKYLKTEISKEDRGLIHRQGINERVLAYCSRDVEFLHRLRDAQLVEIDKWNLRKVLDLENNVARSFMLMTYDGILIDSVKWKEVADYVESEVEKIGGSLDSIILNESKNTNKFDNLINMQTNLFDFDKRKTFINWKSPDQKKKILNLLGIRVDSVNDKVLQRNKRYEIVREMINFSKHSKIEDTFGKSFLKNINKTTGRIHASVWQIVSTGRISISNPPLQQIPAHGDLAKKIKECFISKEGYTLVDTDVSAFEICIATQFSQEPKWIEILNNNGDIHSETAMMMFNIPIEKVNDPFPERPNYSYRFIAKSCNFLALYGGNEFTLSDRIQISKEKAKLLLNKYFESLPKLKAFLDMIANTAVKRGMIRSDPYYKRIRWFPKLKEDDQKSINATMREAMNHPMQSMNANLIKECLINLNNEIEAKKFDARILLQIHDALLSEVRDDQLEEWKATKERIMIETISKHITLVPVKVSTTFGKHWNH